MGLALVLSACTTPCEPPPGIEHAFEPVPYVPLEMVVVVDGSRELGEVRPLLEPAWRSVLDYAIVQRDDGEAAYLHERARIRFVAPAPACAAPACNGRAAAEWVRYAPERDDAAFLDQGLCLFRAIPDCAEHRPLDALLATLAEQTLDPRSDLVLVIVSARDDASTVEPDVAARALVELRARAGTLKVAIAAGLQAGPSCGWGLDATVVPRLAAFASALRAAEVWLTLGPVCGAQTDTRALGGDGPTLDRRWRAAPWLAGDASGRVRCVLEEVLPTEGPVQRCADVTHLGRTLVRVGVGEREVCTIPQRPARDGPGWYADPFEIHFVPGSEPMPGAEVRLSCDADARACTTDEDCWLGAGDAWRELRRCDPEALVCVGACSFGDCADGETCELASPPTSPGWCVPRPQTCSR